MDPQNPDPRTLRQLSQERLDAALSDADAAFLEAALAEDEQAAAAAEGLAAVHAMLSTPTLIESPGTLRAQIMARVAAARRLERLHRRAALSLLTLVGSGAALYYREGLAAFASTLQSLPGETLELVQPGEGFFQSLGASLGSLSGVGSVPLAFLALLPLLFAVNIIALRKTELRHA